jgi:mannosyltransferase OCH1-like enzyme
MKENVETLKRQNPEFTHYLYDDAMCREFIKDNFDADVLYSFDKLKPGAYKADLWRYCILYKKGGIYLDIKYKCLSHFKLIELTNKEYCVRDRWHKGTVGIYNALLSFKRNNDMLYKCIQNIVYNVKNNIYGYSELYITGPHLMSKFFSREEIINLPLFFDGKYILFNNVPGLIVYDTYREEQRNSKSNYYEKMWRECDVYNYPILQQTNCNEYEYSNLPIVIHKWYPLEFNYINSENIETKTIPTYFKSVQGYCGYIKNNEIAQITIFFCRF